MGEYEAELVNVTKRKDKSNLEIGLLCFHNLYGGGAEYADKLSSQALPAMIRKALHVPRSEKFEIWGSGKQYRDFLCIPDAISGLFAMEGKGMNQGVIQIGTGMPTTLLDAAKIVQRLTNVLKTTVPLTAHFVHGVRLRAPDLGPQSLCWQLFATSSETSSCD